MKRFALRVVASSLPDEACTTRLVPGSWYAVALSVGFSGVVMVVAPAFVRTDPVSDDEKYELARQARKARSFAPTDLRMGFAPPPPGLSGGSLVLSGRF